MALPWPIVRPPAVYGERDREMLKLFKLTRRGLGPVFGDGSQELSVIYAGDLASALVATVASAAANRVYYAAHPALTTSRGLVRAIGRAVGREPRILRCPPRWCGGCCGRSGRSPTWRVRRRCSRRARRPSFSPRHGPAAPTR